MQPGRLKLNEFELAILDRIASKELSIAASVQQLHEVQARRVRFRLRQATRGPGCFDQHAWRAERDGRSPVL